MYDSYKKQLFLNAVHAFGRKSQKIQAIEELSELIQAITKEIRQKPNAIENITEEIGDVEIMLEQLKIMYDIDLVKLAEVKDEKLHRLENDIKVLEAMRHGCAKFI